MLFQIFSKKTRSNANIVLSLYESIADASRQEGFYTTLSTPDTPLGRFEIFSIHTFLAVYRLFRKNKTLNELGHDLIDKFFELTDHSIRELGVSDVAVPKRMKKLALLFYGRVQFYDDALKNNDQEALSRALKRNIHPENDQWTGAAAMSEYMFGAKKSLAEQPDEQLCKGILVFPVLQRYLKHSILG